MYKLKKNIFKQKISDGQLIIRDSNNEQIHVLNSTSAYILENSENKNADEIANSIFKGLDKSCNVTFNEILNDVTDTINNFKTNGLLIDEENINLEYKQAKIKNLYIEIISSCNQKCIYCYNEKELYKKNIISLNQIKKLIDQCIPEELNGIIISGGEPLLHKDLEKILEYCKDKKVGVSLVSNGTLINEEKAKMLSKFNPNIQFTIDGSKALINDKSRGYNSFKKQIEALENLKKSNYKGNINLRTNLWSGNTDEANIRSIVRICENYNINKLNLITAKKTNNFNLILSNEKDFNNIIKIIKDIDTNVDISYDEENQQYKCELDNVFENIEYALRISPDGNVYPCQYFLDNQFSIGNIYYHSLYEMIHGDKNKKILSLISLRKFFIKECTSCTYSQICHGGCPAKAYINYGDIFRADGSCKRKKISLQKYYLDI